MFRLVALAASNPSLGADSHTPDAGGRFGPLPTGILPACLLRQFQSLLNAAARLVYRMRARNHITDALISLRSLCYRPSVCRLSVVCNVRALYLGGSNFRQYFYGIRYLGYPLTSTENFTEIVPGEPIRRGS